MAFRKPGVRLLSWRRAGPKSVLAIGTAGAVLIRVAFRSRIEVYTKTRRMVGTSLCDVLKGEEVQLIVGRNRTCIHAFLGARGAYEKNDKRSRIREEINTRYATGDQ